MQITIPPSLLRGFLKSPRQKWQHRLKALQGNFEAAQIVSGELARARLISLIS